MQLKKGYVTSSDSTVHSTWECNAGASTRAALAAFTKLSSATKPRTWSKEMQREPEPRWSLEKHLKHPETSWNYDIFGKAVCSIVYSGSNDQIEDIWENWKVQTSTNYQLQRLHTKAFRSHKHHRIEHYWTIRAWDAFSGISRSSITCSHKLNSVSGFHCSSVAHYPMTLHYNGEGQRQQLIIDHNWLGLNETGASWC